MSQELADKVCRENKMRVGTIHKLIIIFYEAFEELGLCISSNTLEDLAIVIIKSMSTQGRHYHNLEHVFSFIEQGKPLQTLAALFHDIVYCQVDHGFSSRIRTIISPFTDERDGAIYIIPPTPPSDQLLGLTLDVFGFKPGEKLPPNEGLNEFLSALVANKLLEGILSPKDLLIITLCIEATIPFRGKNAQGESQTDLLERQLPAICNRWGIHFSDLEIEDSLKSAVRFANKDLQSFAEKDERKFLAGTWKLLSETNLALQSQDICSVKEYRRALQKMEAFLSELNPSDVFLHYRDEPSEAEYQQMSANAHRNISIGRQYLQIKLLTQAIIEALAVMTGGDAPLALFMGEIPLNSRPVEERSRRLEDLLPEVIHAPWVYRSGTMYKLLASERLGDSNFDIKTAPLSLFLYKSISPEQRVQYQALAKEMFAGQIDAQTFLEALDPSLVSSIAKASAAMALTRRAQLLRYTLPS